MKISCETRDEWLGPSLYEDLPFDRGLAAEEHLANCASCREEASSLRKLMGWLPAPVAVPVAPSRRKRWPFLAAAGMVFAGVVGYALGQSPSATSPRPVWPELPPPQQSTRPDPLPQLFSPEVCAFLQRGRAGLPDSKRDWPNR